MFYKEKIGVIVITVVCTVAITIGIGMIVISHVGVQKTTEEVSPLINAAKDRVTKGIVPEIKRTEAPKSDADRLMEAIAQNQGNSVMILTGEIADTENVDMDSMLIARGIVWNSDGWIVTDGAVIEDDRQYTIVVPGVREGFIVREIKHVKEVALLRIDHAFLHVPTFASVTDAGDELPVGVISGGMVTEMHVGVVVQEEGVANDVIMSTIIGTMTPGSALVAIDGKVIGIALSEHVSQNGGQIFFALASMQE